MNRLIALSEVPDHPALLAECSERTGDTRWVAVSASELHLTCRHFPLALAMAEGGPRLGLITDDRYLTYRLHDENGQWLGAYRPIGVRCFPFSVRRIGDDPLADIVVDEDRIAGRKADVRTIPAAQAERHLAELHRLCCLLKRSEDLFAAALDQLLIAEVFVPLNDEAERSTNLSVIDPERLSGLGKPALGALGRHSFRSIDVAIAGLFSLRNLKPEFRPSSRKIKSEPAPASIAPDPIDDVGLALDDSELIGLGLDGMFSTPAPALR